MRVIVAATGTAGDVYPVLGFGRYLKTRGHEVLVATSANFARDVREAGLECIDLIDAETYEAMRAATERLMARPLHFIRSGEFHESYFRLPELLYRAVERNLEPGNTVLAAIESFTVGAGGIASETLGVPYVSLWHNVGHFRLLQPWFPDGRRGIDYFLKDQLARLSPLPRLKGEVDRLRATLNLPRVPSLTKSFYFSQQLSICLFPRWYVSPWYRDRFPNAVLTDFPLYEPRQDEALPADAEAFLSRGSPPVVFNTASWIADRKDYFEVALAVCRDLGLRAILLGPGSSAFSGRQENVYTVDYMSYQRLLPRAAAFVHHGGIGSIARGLAAGIPQLVVPQQNDTPSNGVKLERLGAGMVLSGRRYESRLGQKLQQLLSSDEIKASARKLAERFAESPDFSGAAEAMERLLPDVASPDGGRTTWRGWSAERAIPT